MSQAGLPSFNRIVRRFADDLARPSYRAQRSRQRSMLVKMCHRGLFVRQDPARDWEHSHVAIQLKATMPAGSKIVDFGGGGSIQCYEMAASGYDVTVLDINASICRTVNINAGRLGLGASLRAIPHDGRSRWPFGEGDIDVVVSVSVFEALLRRQRAAFFAECRRVLRLEGELLMTFDFGEGARLVGNPPRSVEDVLSEIVGPSGLALSGELPPAPCFGAEAPAPVRLAVPDVDGFDYVTAAYTFAALRFLKEQEAEPDAQAACTAAPVRFGSQPDLKAECKFVLRRICAGNRLSDLGSTIVGFEIWGDTGDERWFWEILQRRRQVDATPLRPDCVLAGTRKALGELLRHPEEFWTLQYRGEFAPRGDLSIALRLVDLFPPWA